MALAFLVVFCALLIPRSYSTREFVNVIPISRRSFLNRRALAGDFDSVSAINDKQSVRQKYLPIAPEVILGFLPAPGNNIEEFVKSKFLGKVPGTADDILSQQVVDSNVNIPSILELIDVVENDIDVMYEGTLSIGTPSQALSLDIDTGSADLWVASTWCSTCTSSHFDGSESSTFRNSGTRFAVSYGSGDVYGTTATDTVTIAGATVQNQTFGVVYRESQEFQESRNDGLLGMAFGTIAQSREPTLFETMILQGKVAWPCFSIHLARRQSGSEMCLGCYDATKAVGALTWFPVTQPAYWSIAMNGFEVASQRTFLDEDVIAAIDTGTSFIYFPRTIVAEIYARIPGSKDASTLYGSGFYTYPCASDIIIEFVFGNSSFQVHPDDFNLGTSMYDPSDCVGGIFGMDDSQWPTNLAIIGDEFLTSWYAVYDYSEGGRVGFAPSIKNHYCV
jgi:hypothetical protein